MAINVAETLKSLPFLAVLLVGDLGLVTVVHADTLTMRNGTVLEGTYAGGTGKTLKFTAPG